MTEIIRFAAHGPMIEDEVHGKYVRLEAYQELLRRHVELERKHADLWARVNAKEANGG